jgi:dihydrofolate reductase
MLSIIVAKSQNDCIGIDNNLPWKLSSDLKKFKEITTGHKVIMGRKTFESIIDFLGKPLPERQSIVITRNKDYKYENCIVVNSLDEAINLIESNEEAFVIGGAEIYKQALQITDKIYITEVNTKINGNKFFPKIDHSWKEVKRESFQKTDRDDFSFDFVEYLKK